MIFQSSISENCVDFENGNQQLQTFYETNAFVIKHSLKKLFNNPSSFKQASNHNYFSPPSATPSDIHTKFKSQTRDADLKIVWKLITENQRPVTFKSVITASPFVLEYQGIFRNLWFDENIWLPTIENEILKSMVIKFHGILVTIPSLKNLVDDNHWLFKSAFDEIDEYLLLVCKMPFIFSTSIIWSIFAQ